METHSAAINNSCMIFFLYLHFFLNFSTLCKNINAGLFEHKRGSKLKEAFWAWMKYDITSKKNTGRVLNTNSGRTEHNFGYSKSAKTYFREIIFTKFFVKLISRKFGNKICRKRPETTSSITTVESFTFKFVFQVLQLSPWRN